MMLRYLAKNCQQAIYRVYKFSEIKSKPLPNSFLTPEEI